MPGEGNLRPVVGAPESSGAPLPPIEPATTEAEQQRIEARKATDRLNETNRILVEARMLDRTTPLTADQTRIIIDRYLEILSTGMTAKAVAKQCGYSKSALSEWAAEKYKGDNDSITHAVNDWMERNARREQSRRPRDYVRTWVAEDIRTYVYMADKRTMMAAVVVPSGAGKTMVLKALTEEMRGVYICCDSGMTARDLYRAIAVALGWQKQRGTRGELLRFVVERLAGTKRIIFLDEAHKLGQWIGYVRDIHDQANVPIIMAGADEILLYINDRAHGRGQFSSRTIRYNAMDHVKNVEGPDGGASGRDLFTVDEIKAFFAMKQVRLDRDALKMMWAIACIPNYGTLRLVENTLDTILDLDRDVSVITREHVVAALQSVVGAEAIYLQKLARRQTEDRHAPAAVARAG